MPTTTSGASTEGARHDGIPKERYTDRAFAALEWQRMWTKVWLLAGRTSDVVEPGDYFTFEIGTESVLVVRQADGSIAARHNVCMHRGNRLREPGRGHASEFACLFHGWRYGIDGTLLEALDAESFPQGTPCDRLSLRPVRCDTWAGFVFVCLDPDVESLADYLGVVSEHLDAYGLERWKIAFDCTIAIECNWKTSVDAFNEAYHISATHPWTIAFSDDTRTQYDCYDKHTRMIFPEVQASLRHPGAGTVTPEIREFFLERVGVKDFAGTEAEARRAFADAVRAMAPLTGADFSRLSDAQMCDDFHYTVFPNLTLNTHSMFVWVFTHRPHPDDPNRMFFDFLSLVNAPSQDVPRPAKLFLDGARETCAGKVEGGDLIDEDLYNLPRIQLGMRSAAFRELHLGAQEVRIRHFHDTLMHYVDGEPR